MLSFLNPGVLWALPLAAAPVVLHLLFLRRARRVPFGDLSLLRAAYLRSLPSSRLRQRLLLAARCLALAALALAFARPVLRAGAAGAAGGEVGLRLVFLADVSYSMGYRARGRTRLEAVQAHAAALVGLLRPQDRVAVAAFDDRLEGAGRLEWSRSPASAAAALRRLEPGSRVTDYLPALREAYAFLGKDPEARQGRRAIVLLSDGAAHGWRSDGARRLSQSLPGYDPAILLLGLRWEDEADNAAVLSAGLGGASEEMSVRLGLRGAGRRDWELDLWTGERRSGQRQLRLDPGEVSTSFELRPGAGPSAWGRVELRPDALAADDAYHYALRPSVRPKVLLVTGGPRSLEVGRGGYFLTKLFVDARGSLLPYELEVSDSQRVRSLALADYKAVVLVDFRRVEDALGASLERYVRGGGGLWLIAAQTEAPDAWRALARLLPARLGEPEDYAGGRGLRPAGAPAGRSAPTGPLPVGTAEAENVPPRVRFSWEDFELQSVSVRRAYALEPAPGSETWLQDPAGRPLWVWGRYGEGRALVWGSSLDFHWTNLAVKPVFAAWVDYGLARLTGYTGAAQWRTVKVGEPIVRVWGPGEPAPSRVRLRLPGGRGVKVDIRGRRLDYPAERPGLYVIEDDPAEPGGPQVYAANLDRGTREWDLSPDPAPPWTALRPESLTEDFTRALYGKEARQGLLAVALLALALEAFLAAPRLAALALLLLLPGRAAAQQGGAFVWAQLRYNGAWDPYPGVHADILKFTTSVTSILAVPERKVLTLKDPDLFGVPFLLLAGRWAPPSLDDEELARLRGWLTSGGFLWIEDASGMRAGPFDRWVRSTLRLIFPDSDLVALGSDHVVHRTFFLMRGAGGRLLVSGSLEGIDWGGRTAVVYSRNDLLGAWAKDAMGRHLYECVPGGEPQRMNARKLTLNIVMYSLTGSYKTDAVHQPYILEKMRLGLPP